MFRSKKLIAALLASLLPVPAMAAINGADTTWVMIATAMVMIMTPGLAFFYAGMVRTKNVVTTLSQSFICLGVIGLVWAIIGYSLAFGTGDMYIGDTMHYMLRGVGMEPEGTATIPPMLFMMFQMMFAIITPALMTGAFAERVRFQSWLLILVLWSLAVYAPVAHWVWTAGGFLAAKGAQDFAGGLVVHMTAGFSALAAAIVIGKRRDFGTAAKPYNIGMIVLGTTLLWFGWFGFNAGSALAANGQAVQAFTNTFLASAAAMVMWVLVDHVKDGKPALIGACIAVVAGLIAITPAAGYVTAESAIIIGLVAGFICNNVARLVKGRYAIDDSLDVFACHGVGGLIGVLAVGFLGDAAIGGANGSLNGGDTLLGAQATAAVIVAIYSMVVTVIIVKLVGMIMPIRVTDAEEKLGLDVGQHGEIAHNHD